MDNAKIRQMLSDLRQERVQMIAEHKEKLAYLDDVINKMEKFIAGTGGTPTNGATSHHGKSVGQQKTIIQMIEEVLKENGKRVSLDVIVQEVIKARGEPVSRSSIAAGISRHFKKVGKKESRIKRLGGGLYKFREST